VTRALWGAVLLRTSLFHEPDALFQSTHAFREAHKLCLGGFSNCLAEELRELCLNLLDASDYSLDANDKRALFFDRIEIEGHKEASVKGECLGGKHPWEASMIVGLH
jgi:hypothetical protein